MADNDQTEISKTEVRGGATPHVVRHVLAISLVLVIVAFGVIVAIGMR